MGVGGFSGRLHPIFFFGLNLEVSLNVKGEECTLLLLVSEAVVTSVSPHTCSGTD